MALVVEDGSIVPGANAYVDLASVRAYALARGIVLPVDDDECSVLVIKATDYLESKRCLYQGWRVTSLQDLSWPRSNIFIYGEDFPPNAIPGLLTNAQMALTVIANSGVDLLPLIDSSRFVTKEKVGPIATEYSDPAKYDLVGPVFTAVDAMLKPLFLHGCYPNSLTTIRV